VHGVAVDPLLLGRLGVKQGENIRIGTVSFRVSP
jgi:predicted lysophospholipase L1 biosynthesis ABC-type transport system permease subunit